MERRTVLQVLAAAPFAARAAFAAPPANMKGIEELQKSWMALLAVGAKVPLATEPLKLAKEEWRKRLAADAFAVLREEGTERPGTSHLNDEKRPGVFACAGCALPLFTSAMKYDSGTGWPSFFTTIPGVFAMKKDFLLIFPRSEYHCIRGGGKWKRTGPSGSAFRNCLR